MKVSYSEILARNAGPESYADRGNTLGVVTAGVQPGAVIELRKQSPSECRRRRGRGRQHEWHRYWRDVVRFGGVKELRHGWKSQTREPGDPKRTSASVTDVGPKTPQEVQRT